MARRWNQEAPKPDNPKCIVCRRPMAAEHEWSWPPTVVGEDGIGRSIGERIRGKLLGYGYMANGYFCTKNCGWKWAAKSVGPYSRAEAEDGGVKVKALSTPRAPR